MKRSERKKVKTDTQQPHPEPHHNETDNHERHISGDIHIRGEVETKFPPDLVKKHDTEREQDTTRDDKRFIVEVLTLIFVGIYAALAFWQGCSAQKAAKTASDNLTFTQQQFRMDQRPYVTTEAFGAHPVGGDNKATFVRESSGEISIRLYVQMTNVGRTPAIHMLTTRTKLIVDTMEKATNNAKSYVPDYGEGIVGSVLAPGTNPHVLPTPPFTALNKQDFDRLTNGEIAVYAVGGIQYGDIFDPPLIKPYETIYCYQILPPPSLPFGTCSFTNSIK